MRRKKERDLKRTRKFLMPKHYVEFLRKAMTEEGREAASSLRPPDQFSRACLANQHGVCRGLTEIDYGRKGPIEEPPECICFCHLSLVE